MSGSRSVNDHPMGGGDPGEPIELDLVLENRRERIDEARESIIEAIRRSGCDETASFAIRLALEEALTNAYKHGNREDPEKQIQLRCTIHADEIRIDVIDQGPGFNPDAVPDPTRDENLEIPSGRGIVLMRSFMSHVEYVPPGNQVSMTYRRSTGGEGSDDASAS